MVLNKSKSCWSLLAALLPGLAFCVFLAIPANAQDTSVVDAARQQRQKSNSTSTPVVDNDSVPSVATRLRTVKAANPPKGMSPEAFEKAGEKWKEQIAAQKSKMAGLQQRIDQLNDTIRATNLGCTDNCVPTNLRLKGKVDELNNLKLEFAEQQRQLEVLQDSARKQGFGSAVYDP